MSESGDSKWGTAFFLGFLLGVFVCLGGGGTFVAFQYQRSQRQLHEVMEAEMVARDAEMKARAVAELRRQEAERRLRSIEVAGKQPAELLPPPKEKGAE